MSVNTAADEKLDEARRAIATAIKALAEIVINECWGHDEYKPELREAMEQALRDLMEVKKKIQGHR